MKIHPILGTMVTGALMLLVVSCSKEASIATTSNAEIASEVSRLQAISIGTTNSASGSSADSIYVINTCSRNSSKDSIAASALPAAVTVYLESNYPGYTFQKAFSISDRSGTITGYVVIINYNSAPSGLKFDAAGSFARVLEQRAGRELAGCRQNADSTSSK